MTTFVSHNCKNFTGNASVPGDKSISIRALILAGLANGKSQISGLHDLEDVWSVYRALEALGVRFHSKKKILEVTGRGEEGFRSYEGLIDLGNSGTGARLLLGALAGFDLKVGFTGDASLRKRPFERVIQPLTKMGASFDSWVLPITLTGSANLKGKSFGALPPSAQVKSAVLLAGLRAIGGTTVIEKTVTRDHTERMMIEFGISLLTAPHGSGQIISFKGPQTPKATFVKIPGDISAASFLIAAGMIVGSGPITISGVGLNPTRTAILDIFSKMGAKIDVKFEKNDSGEPFGNLTITPGPIKGIRISQETAPLLIDEFPILFTLAAFANGPSKFEGLSELRHKESDRLAVMAQGLSQNGVKVEEDEASLSVYPGPVTGGGVVDACHDHRIAMSFLVLGLGAQNPVAVTGAETISTSFPGFVKVMNGLGAQIKEAS